MELTYCPNCGHRNEPGARFCEQCGCDLMQAAQRAQQNMSMSAQQNSGDKTPKSPKQKKSHLGLILGITIPLVLIGLAAILILTGMIKLPFMDSGEKLVGTWYEFAATTPEDGLRSLHDLAVLQDKDVNDIRLTMIINKDGKGQLIGGEDGSRLLNWTESDERYTIICDGVIYTGNFENDNEFSLTGADNVKLQFSQDISHQIPNQIEVTPSPSPSPLPTPEQTIEPYYDTEDEEYDDDVYDDMEMEEAEEDEVTDSDYIFPNSDSEYLTKSDIKGMSKSEINLAKNELYARHGRKFKSKELQDYFDSKDWYEGIYTPKQWDKKGDSYFFNNYEIKNRDLLKKHEK